MPTVDPMQRWRLLIKEMGGSTGIPAANKVTVNSTTFLWTTNTTTGIIDPYPHAETIAAGGPYAVEAVIVPYDPVHATGGSFYRFLEGPGAGKLVSFWTNSLGYGSITVSQTSSYDRGPGDTVLTLEYPAAHSCDATLNYNAAGEMHFTLLVDDPNIDLLRPKRQHYVIEFWDGAAWVEVDGFAGMLWDFEATDTEVIYYGIDYLGLLKYVWDERFDTTAPKKPYPTGSFYVGTGLTISDVVTAHLTYATGLTDSLVSFIDVGTIAAMSEEITIYSTMTNAFDFVIGLLDSHRAGTGKFTRLSVKKIAGTYTFVVEDDPGSHKDDLALQYVAGGLVQGYKAIPFGPDWASRVNYVGKARDGGLLMYEADDSAVDQAEWGRIGQAPAFIESHDRNDLKRRARQAAVDASKLGRSIAAGLKLGSFRPLQGYDICDQIPVGINHGAVVTGQWGSDGFGTDPSGDPSAIEALYWSIIGITFTSFDDGHWETNLGLWPTGGGAPLALVCSYVAPVFDGPRSSLDIFGHDVGWAGDVQINGLPSNPTNQWISGTYYEGSPISSYGTAGDTSFGLNAGVVTTTTIEYRWYWDVGSPRFLCHVQGGAGVLQYSDDSATWTNATVDGADVPMSNGPHRYWALHYGPEEQVGGLHYWAGVDAAAFLAWEGIPNFGVIADPITPQTPLSAGNGPPDPTNTSSETYIDLSTGQQYVRNDVTDTWDLVSGTRPLVVEPGAALFAHEHDLGGLSDGLPFGLYQNGRNTAPIALDDLSDVNAPTPSNLDLLQWDSATSRWVPAAQAAALLALDDLTDVQIASVAVGNVLRYNGTAWVNAAGSLHNIEALGDIPLGLPEL